MSLAELAAAHRLRQQAAAASTLGQARRLWRMLDPGNPGGSWASSVGRLLLATMVAAQAEAARGADDYVSAALTMQNATPDPAGRVPAAAFAGVASDGRDLAGLLSYPVFEVGAFIDQGLNPAGALAIGGRHLDRIVLTQVADAARISTGVATVNDTRTRGWVRHVSPPCCSRCAILAGKFYRYNQGFQRHPQCDCVHMPSAEVIEPQSPKALFDQMTPDQLTKAGWSKADVRAINDGADIYQVTNARRDLSSMSVAGHPVQTTLQGTTRRGLAGRRLGAGSGARAVRLTPEQIYIEAERLGWSRAETIRQLKRHGYIL
jgi:hypothetical protein